MSNLKVVCAEIIIVVKPCIRKRFASFSDFYLEKSRSWHLLRSRNALTNCCSLGFNNPSQLRNPFYKLSHASFLAPFFAFSLSSCFSLIWISLYN